MTKDRLSAYRGSEWVLSVILDDSLGSVLPLLRKALGLLL